MKSKVARPASQEVSFDGMTHLAGGGYFSIGIGAILRRGAPGAARARVDPIPGSTTRRLLMLRFATSSMRPDIAPWPRSHPTRATIPEWTRR